MLVLVACVVGGLLLSPNSKAPSLPMKAWYMDNGVQPRLREVHTVSAEDTTWEIASRRRSPLGVKGQGLLEIQGQRDSLSPSHVFLTILIAYSSSVKEACGTKQLIPHWSLR